MKNKEKKNKKSAVSKKELMYQKLIGTYSEKNNCVFTDDGVSIRISENKPTDPVLAYCAPASSKDRVEVMITSYDKNKPVGYISKVLSRFTNVNVGLAEARNGNMYLQPFGTQFGSNILIAPSHTNGAVDGNIVTFILLGKDEYDNYIVHVNDVIGHKNEPNAFVKAIYTKYGMATDYSEAAHKQALTLPTYVRNQDKVDRTDLTEELTVTVDCSDTKDRDDAFTVRRLPNGNFEVRVDIADVDYYVPIGSPLDIEARKRQTSGYAGGQCNPMIDPILSNGICSLNEDVERLAVSTWMEIDNTGKVVNTKHELSVINVRYNMNYDEVMEIFEGNKETCDKYEDAVDMLLDAKDLYKIIESNFKKRGYLEFTGKEAKMIIENDRIKEIVARESNDATKLIQFLMLITNETRARTLANANFPCEFRVHDLPDEEKIVELCDILTELGYSAEYDSFKNPWKFFQNIIRQVRGRDDESYVMELLKRCMKKAKCSTYNIGHFGIGDDIYGFFTSPIRRYCDLDNERSLKAFILKDRSNLEYYESLFEKNAIAFSKAEIKADTVEREVAKIYKCIYIKDFIGEKFTGKICNVVRNGFYVELEDTTTGFVYLGSTAKSIFDEAKMTITDKKTSHKYRLGENVDIIVVAANEIQQTIDFALAA